MALTSQSGMTFGDGLRVTDSLGGCISYGASPIGDDAEFRGPDFSMGFRLKKINTSTSGTARLGIVDQNGTPRRFQLDVEAESGDDLIFARLNINADDGSAEEFVLAQIGEDTDEHSYAVTYDFDGDVNLYIDGELVDNQASTGIDVEGPADSTDTFSVWGSITPGVEVFYVDNAWFTNTAMGAEQVAEIHENGLTGDS